jgi:hypothetical protein
LAGLERPWRTLEAHLDGPMRHETRLLGALYIAEGVLR